MNTHIISRSRNTKPNHSSDAGTKRPAEHTKKYGLGIWLADGGNCMDDKKYRKVAGRKSKLASAYAMLPSPELRRAIAIEYGEAVRRKRSV